MPFPLSCPSMPVPASLCRAPLLRSIFTPSILFLSCPPGSTRSSLRLPFRFTRLFSSLLYSSPSSRFFSLSRSLASTLFCPFASTPCLCSAVRLASLCLACLARAGLARSTRLLCLPVCLPACMPACMPASLPVRVVFLFTPLCALLTTPPLSYGVVRTDTSALHRAHRRVDYSPFTPSRIASRYQPGYELPSIRTPIPHPSRSLPLSSYVLRVSSSLSFRVSL